MPEVRAADARVQASPWQGRRVVLGVCGSVAAYKAVQIARDLTLAGSRVDVVLTESARRFVGPLSFEAVTGSGPLTDMFTARGAALHVGLGRDADCVCIAPATADFIARMAAGRASDLLGTVLSATRAPVVLAPAMNDLMFAHPRTAANLAVLDAMPDVHRVGPATGRLSAGEGSGPGRMADPEAVVDAVGRVLGGGGPLAGRSVLVTSGGTREPVDPVRYLGNRSSGRMGAALARAAWLRGSRVTLVSGPATAPPPHGVEVVAVETALEMRDAVLARIGEVDVAVHAAAVADYRVRAPSAEKLKRGRIGPAHVIDLEANPDIAAEAAAKMRPGSVAAGFALETSDLLRRAGEKMVAKGFDLIAANPAGQPDAGFEADTNRVTLLTRDGASRALPVMSKFAVAGQMLDEIEGLLGRRGGAAR